MTYRQHLLVVILYLGVICVQMLAVIRLGDVVARACINCTVVVQQPLAAPSPAVPAPVPQARRAQPSRPAASRSARL